MNFTGRPMRSMVIVPTDALAKGSALADWVGEGVAFAQSEPPKSHHKSSR